MAKKKMQSSGTIGVTTENISKSSHLIQEQKSSLESGFATAAYSARYWLGYE